jgi:cell division protein FtsZ
MFDITSNEKEIRAGAKIIVVGVGGGGCNAVNTMIRSGLSGVEYVVANTDAQALNINLAPVKIQLGAEITKGLGAGANPDVGRKAALDDYETLSEVLSGADMIFITAGMGGGTGTGAAPVIAKLAKEMGALTVGVVTKPFMFEGKKRMKYADMGIMALEECVDSLITIPNQRLLSIAGENLSLVETFKRADEVLLNAVQGISDLINNTGLINADFADVSTVMSNKGLALMGTGVASGPERAIKAATLAISSPLLEDITIDGATGIIINITGNSSLTAFETNEAVSLIMEAADDDAEIIFGTVIDEEMNDELKVTVIATGLADRAIKQAPLVSPKANHAFEIEQDAPQSMVDGNSLIPDAPIIAHEAKKLESELDQANQGFFGRSSSNLSESIKEAASRYENKKQKLDSEIKWDMNQAPSKEDELVNLNKSKTKSLAEKLGFINFDDDEFDTPTYLRQKNLNDSNPDSQEN